MAGSRASSLGWLSEFGVKKEIRRIKRSGMYPLVTNWLASWPFFGLSCLGGHQNLTPSLSLFFCFSVCVCVGERIATRTEKQCPASATRFAASILHLMFNAPTANRTRQFWPQKPQLSRNLLRIWKNVSPEWANIGHWLERSLGKGTQCSRNQWREAPFHWMRARRSVNEGFGTEFYRKRNSMKRSWQFRESPDSKNSIFLWSSPSRISAPSRICMFPSSMAFPVIARKRWEIGVWANCPTHQLQTRAVMGSWRAGFRRGASGKAVRSALAREKIERESPYRWVRQC